MNGSSLERRLKSDPIIKASYVGIYSIDSTWPKPVFLPACYVINTDTYDGPGEHWVSFYMDNDNTADYFDSFGTVPVKSTYSWLRSCGMKQIRYNKKWLQNPDSTVCWAYCILFLRMRCRGVPLEDIIASFYSYDFLKNDMIVMSLVD